MGKWRGFHSNFYDTLTVDNFLDEKSSTALQPNRCGVILSSLRLVETQIGILGWNKTERNTTNNTDSSLFHQVLMIFFGKLAEIVDQPVSAIGNRQSAIKCKNISLRLSVPN